MSVTNILGGGSDNAGSGIARRLGKRLNVELHLTIFENNNVTWIHVLTCDLSYSFEDWSKCDPCL